MDSMADNEDDNTTVVLDVNQLKEQMAKGQAPQEDEDLGIVDVDIEFSIDTDDSQTNTEITTLPVFPIICFDFGSDMFSQLKSSFPSHLDIIVTKDVKELNKLLTKIEFKILFLNYDGSPQAVNQVSTQVRQKFPHCKSIIIAKGLNPQKAQAHQKTKAGAEGYMSHPLTKEKLSTEIEKIYKKFN